jgi:thymidine phosphorylase
MKRKNASTLKLKRLHIDTQIEHVVYMAKNCSIYKSEGFESLSRVQVSLKNKSLIATLNIIDNDLLQEGEAGLSENAWHLLEAKDCDEVSISHPKPVESMAYVRAKIYGKLLSKENFNEILSDIIQGRYSNIEISAFITACAGDNLSIEEITGLSQAMVDTGQHLHWNKALVVDKHCVGGLPGNRTTPIVVSIVAAAGLTIPKTSSRAITSPAGTADAMETITKVDLNLDEIKKVVEKENGCLAWGGSVKLSPADDIVIRIERALDIDSEGQMIASVLSKKSAAGSTHVVIDIPVGKTAKVRTAESAEKLKYYFKVIGAAMNMKIKVMITDGSQPVGRGIGPALEAMDVLSVLRNETHSPQDLKIRSLEIAAEVLELAEIVELGKGFKLAEKLLSSGEAYSKFESICKAQGAFKVPEYAPNKIGIEADKSGVIVEIDNRKLAKLAKLAGAPKELSAGVLMQCHLNKEVKKGEILFYIYSAELGELNYALDYLKSQTNIIRIE